MDFVLSNKVMFVYVFVLISLSLLPLFPYTLQQAKLICNGFFHMSPKRDTHSIILSIKNQLGFVYDSIYARIYIFKFFELLYKFVLNVFYTHRFHKI